MIVSSPSSPHTRGQLFAGGIVFAFASAFLVGGLSMAIGIDVLVAATWGLFSFFVVGLIGWVAELSLGPSLERVALEREKEREEAERLLSPTGGAALPISPVLTGGVDASAAVPPGLAQPVLPARAVLTSGFPPLQTWPPGVPSFASGYPASSRPAQPAQPAQAAPAPAKGRTVDFTLPEESAAAGELSAVSSRRSAVGDQRSAVGDQRSAVGDQRSAVGAPPAAAAPPSSASTPSSSSPQNEFLDLASLLRETPPAVPVRR